VVSNDAVTEKLYDMMKASVEASQKQATELQALSTKVATMSSKQRQAKFRSAGTSERHATAR
jgi:hypothetical protein